MRDGGRPARPRTRRQPVRRLNGTGDTDSQRMKRVAETVAVAPPMLSVVIVAAPAASGRSVTMVTLVEAPTMSGFDDSTA